MHTIQDYRYSFDESEENIDRLIRRKKPDSGRRHTATAIPGGRKGNLRKVANTRSNRPWKFINSYECCNSGCLYSIAMFGELDNLRRTFDRLPSYNDQNNFLINLMEITCSLHRFRVKYKVIIAHTEAPKIICREAFLKIFGISKKKIQVLLKKLQPYNSIPRPDQRGKHGKCRRISRELKEKVSGVN